MLPLKIAVIKRILIGLAVVVVAGLDVVVVTGLDVVVVVGPGVVVVVVGHASRFSWQPTQTAQACPSGGRAAAALQERSLLPWAVIGHSHASPHPGWWMPSPQ